MPTARAGMVGAAILLAACGSPGGDAAESGGATPDATSEGTSPAVPLPPETEPGGAGVGGAAPATSTDTTGPRPY